MSNSEDGDHRVYGRLVFETSQDENTKHGRELDNTAGTIHNTSILSLSTSDAIWKDTNHFDEYNGAFTLYFSLDFAGMLKFMWNDDHIFRNNTQFKHREGKQKNLGQQ